MGWKINAISRQHVLNSLNVKSLEKLANLGTLQRLVQVREEQGDAVSS